jgi:hypothetical protein
MNDVETFLTEVYVMVDDYFGPGDQAVRPRRGPRPALARSEVVTLALMSQVGRFRSGRDFYRFAEARLRPLFPTLPHRSQFVRQVLRWWAEIAALAVAVGARLAAGGAYEVVDGTAMPTRNGKRRGRGWLAGAMDVGWSNRLGWYTGAHVLTCVSPSGVLTGFGMAPASTNDRPLLETLLAQRAAPTAALASAGRPLSGTYLADQGFGGRELERRYGTAYQATLLCPPQRGRKSRVWPKSLRQWLIRHRQIVETVHQHLIADERLDANRPHSVAGALANLACLAALHNVWIAINRAHGRSDLVRAGTIAW